VQSSANPPDTEDETPVVDQSDEGKNPFPNQMDVSDLDNEISGNRRIILDALRFFGGDANTKKIQTHPEPHSDRIASGSIHHSLNLLENANMIKRLKNEDGSEKTEATDSGQMANVYALTDYGWYVIEELGTFGTVTDDKMTEIVRTEERLERRIDTLEDRMGDKGESLGELESRVEERMENMEEKINEIVTHVNTSGGVGNG